MRFHDRCARRNLRNPLLAISFLLLVGCASESTRPARDRNANESAAEAAAITAAQGIDPSDDCHAREPVLFYDVSGGALTGLYHRRLSVYTDGTASVSEAIGKTSSAACALLDPAAVERLRERLIETGAQSFRDDCREAADLPMTTVTFFILAGPKATANTYSYYVPEGDRAPADGVINDFIGEYFPDF